MALVFAGTCGAKQKNAPSDSDEKPFIAKALNGGTCYLTVARLLKAAECETESELCFTETIDLSVAKKHTGKRFKVESFCNTLSTVAQRPLRVWQLCPTWQPFKYEITS